MLGRELNPVLRNKFNWVLSLNRMVKWLGLTPWRSQLEFLLLFLQTVSLSFSRSHMTNKVKVRSARDTDIFQLSWSRWSARRHGSGVLFLKGAQHPFPLQNITDWETENNLSEVGETFYYSHPPRADSICINMGNRASGNGEDTDESSPSQMILRTDDHLFKEFYSPLFIYCPSKKIKVYCRK